MEIIIKNKLIFEKEKVLGCVIGDKIARANFHPGTKISMAYVEQLTTNYQNKKLTLDEKLKIIKMEDI